MKPIRIVCLLCLVAVLFSCRTQQKIPNYLENVSDTSGVGMVNVPELKIQKNDLLSIQVYSASTRPELSDAIFNQPGAPSAGATTPGQPTVITGYLVNANGDIEFPRVGTIRAEGLTKLQLADVIKRKINEKDSVLTNPSVIIRFQNLKVTVMGEVNAQGVLSVPGERVTILEAIGLAGGVNDFGLKNAVKVIRENDGKREIGIVDLSSSKLFESPYYNLMQNDVVFVDPTPRKARKADQDVVIQRVSFGLSVLTAFALVYNIIQ